MFLENLQMKEKMFKKHYCESCASSILRVGDLMSFRKYSCFASGYEKIYGFEVDLDAEWGCFVSAADPFKFAKTQYRQFEEDYAKNVRF